MADLAIVLAGLLLAGLAAWLVYSGPAAANLIIQAGQDSYIYPLDTNTRISIQGVMGPTLVEILDGRARIVESPCTNKTCITAGWLRGTGDWTACLPNAVFLRIEGAHDDEELDAVLY